MTLSDVIQVHVHLPDSDNHLRLAYVPVHAVTLPLPCDVTKGTDNPTVTALSQMLAPPSQALLVFIQFQQTWILQTKYQVVFFVSRWL